MAMLKIGPAMESAENTAFYKEFQRKESKNSINFLKNLPAQTKADLTGKREYLNTKNPQKSAMTSTAETAKEAQAHMSDKELLNHLSMIEKGSKEFMHKRDMFSEYVEAAARFKCLIKDNTVAVVPKYVPRALRPQTPGRKWYAPVMKLPPGWKEGDATPSVLTPASPPPPPIANPAQG
ncbi:hypothetical protein R1flu_002936 [Riccia fluitans]|uniref:Uncharacterized protein n=1 Tax=Riccia fluitans TaxID=41844 RepID=A0ABD1Y7J3_9MARC